MIASDYGVLRSMMDEVFGATVWCSAVNATKNSLLEDAIVGSPSHPSAVRSEASLRAV
jgi:hypothetical protein